MQDHLFEIKDYKCCIITETYCLSYLMVYRVVSIYRLRTIVNLTKVNFEFYSNA